MRTMGNRRGFTLVELMTTVGLFGAIAACTLGMMLNALEKTDGSSVKSYADADAVAAMTRLVQDVREAKSVTPLDLDANGDGHRLSIIKPSFVANGAWTYYDRRTLNSAGEIQYFLSNSTGVVGRSGTWLWRTELGRRSSVVKRDISKLLFKRDITQDSKRAVEITINTRSESAEGAKETALTQRVVYVRNF